jgi:hypothetical protein
MEEMTSIELCTGGGGQAIGLEMADSNVSATGCRKDKYC